MTKDEARTLLVEQGAQVLSAQLRIYEGKRTLNEALQPLMEAENHGLGAMFDVDEQEQCFHESCALLGISTKHPAFDSQRRAIEQQRGSNDEERLLSQLQNAEWN